MDGSQQSHAAFRAVEPCEGADPCDDWKDTVILVDGQHRLADTLPNAEKVVFEGEGHMMGAEISEDVFTAMNAFLALLS